MFDGVAKDKGINFEIRVEDGTPAFFYSDEQKLYQILKNFLSNAFKCTRKGSVILTLSKCTSLPRGVKNIKNDN